MFKFNSRVVLVFLGQNCSKVERHILSVKRPEYIVCTNEKKKRKCFWTIVFAPANNGVKWNRHVRWYFANTVLNSLKVLSFVCSWPGYFIVVHRVMMCDGYFNITWIVDVRWMLLLKLFSVRRFLFLKFCTAIQHTTIHKHAAYVLSGLGLEW